MTKYSFIARMPDEPGALHRAADIVKSYSGNINRIQYDRRIDPATVFFEVTATPETYVQMKEDLHAIGYLQETLPALGFLKFSLYLPHQPGSLFELLTYITGAGANIAYIDFDDRRCDPGRVTISLNIEKTAIVESLLDRLKSRYRLDIIEYDMTGEKLDDTVFYVRFAQAVRGLVGTAEDGFLLSFLHDVNHIVQELNSLGQDPKEVFESILATGRTLRNTTGDRFYADLQRIRLSDAVEVFCFQMPCGGNIFLLRAPDETVMIDTGYGIYHEDVMRMFRHYGLPNQQGIGRVYITHADADHCGAGGFSGEKVHTHAGSLAIIRQANRAYGSRSESSILEEVYTTVINLFSRFTPPENPDLFPAEMIGMRSIFPVLARVKVHDIEFEVLESLGGHLHGQVYLFCPGHGIVFTADTLINFGSLDEDRKRYNSLADFLVTSVNVDSECARRERKALLELIRDLDEELSPHGRRCLVAGGHGAVSVLNDVRLEAVGPIERYRAGGPKAD
ncbi:MAG TPA: MBL fold metallo-hydrolase [Methanoculleus sp.]|uniref:MBL fold metallo-hydrolase n=1 Tax=Methanoculleus sp. TaxID=90427 RepID=UPI002D17D989|nr:MBL fold metallo-hydrolase [Methanoculleus sp.]HOC84160.1 MBL fold metallo-hydrolase [Methanoculleus sp.]HQL60163.1 MBL fold metallo-hydrolase [Methanoculleus sp.]